MYVCVCVCVYILIILWFGLFCEGYGFFQHRLSYTEATATVRIRSLFVLNEVCRIACTDTFLFVCVKKTCYNKECGVEHNLNLSFTLPSATSLLY